MIAELVVAAAMLTPHPAAKAPLYEETFFGLVILHDSGGGLTNDFADHFRKLRETDKRVAVKGRCFSACTMILADPKACAMPEAVFGFHAAREYDPKTNKTGKVSVAGNDLLWSHYPQSVRDLFKSGLPEEMVYYKGTLLMKPCNFVTLPQGTMNPQRVQDMTPSLMGPPPMSDVFSLK